MTVEPMPKPRSRKAVAVRSEAVTAPAVLSDSAALLQVIERAATNPEVDIDKMERLLKMHADMTARAAKAAFSAAFAEMQPELPMIDEKGIHEGTQKTYAKWDNITEDLRPILGKHGFGLNFRVKQEAGRITVTGILSHRAGHSDETEIQLPADKTGQKNDVQAVGSSISYGMRYAAKALLSLSSRKSDDDDGKAAGASTITDKQVEEIQTLIVDAGADIRKFCDYMKVEAITDIPAKQFDRAVAALEAKRRSQL
jgi:hypothetical protein